MIPGSVKKPAYKPAEPLDDPHDYPMPARAGIGAPSVFERRLDEADSGGSGGMLKKGLAIGGGVVGFFFAMIVVTAAIRSARKTESDAVGNSNEANAKSKLGPLNPNAFGPGPNATGDGQRGMPAATAQSIVPPEFPNPGAGTEIEPGVTFQELVLRPRPGMQGNEPGQSGKLWVYLPSGDHAPHSLPCVLICGAGSNLITGMELGDGDRPEHLPYVRAGFAVVAYETDGYVANMKQATDQQMVGGIRRFLAAHAGLVNANNALEFTLQRLKQVDPERVYAAGHSSAATTAVLFAQAQPRIKGCVAFAPALDMSARFGNNKSMITGLVPSATAFFSDFNPIDHFNRLNCPFFLFHALDDSNVAPGQSTAAAQKIRGMGKKVTLVMVTSGDHYDSMIREGIPRAINWLKGLPQSADDEGGTIQTGPSSNRNSGPQAGGPRINRPGRPNLPGMPNPPRIGGFRRNMPQAPRGPGMNRPGMPGPGGPR